MIKFGPGGWSALIGEDFTKDNVCILAQAIASLMKTEKCTGKGFIIGYEMRFLSDKAAVWIAEVMAGNGIKVYFIDKIATVPLVMFTVKCLLSHYGCTVTASNNPAYYNGVKIFTKGGLDANEDAIREIEKKIKKVTIRDILQIDYAQGLKSGIIQEIDPFNEYMEFLGL